MAILELLRRDLRHAARALGRTPSLAIMATTTLALGVGASTAAYSVVDGALLKPLEYRDPGRLVAVRLTTPGSPAVTTESTLALSASMYFTFAEQNRVFEHIGIWGISRGVVTGVLDPEEVDAVTVSEGVLEALGVQPLLGRWLSGDDQRPDGAASVMLGYNYWQRRFGGDRSIVGRTINANGSQMVVVGVMPRGFRIAQAKADLIVPFRLDRSRLMLPTFDFRSIARLRPNVTLAEANSDVARMLPMWLESWPPFPGGSASDYEEWRITPAMRSLKDEVVGDAGNVLWPVFGMIGIVLLIACGNVANLLLARANMLRNELAVRVALGARGWRVGRQMLTESLLLALLGGGLGIVFAALGIKLLVAMAPPGIPRVDEIALDARALGFALAASWLAGLACGLVPALRGATTPLSGVMTAAGRVASAGRDGRRVQNALVVGQVTLALVLLVSAGLMIRSFLALSNVEPGFADAEHLQTFRLSIPPLQLPDADQVLRAQNEIIEKLAALPGVESVGFATSIPLEGLRAESNGVVVEDGAAIPASASPAFQRFKFVSPGFLATVGTRIVAGRDITWDDVYSDRPVAMIDENLARELWREPQAALGKRIAQAENSGWREIVGVVQTVQEDGLGAPAPRIVYWPPRMRDHWLAGEFVARRVTVVVRSDRAGSEALVRELQTAVWAVTPSTPVASVRTMQDVYSASLARTTFTLLLLSAAGGMALLLGAVGLYGLITYSVSLRKKEIAIRSALGESAPMLARRFIGHAVVLAGVGVVLGLGGAAAVSQAMESLLFGVEPVDPLTYGVAALALLAVAALASFVPAVRAARIDPMTALRDD